MKKFFESQKLFLIGAIIIGALINRTNCEPDPYCDPDPLYGGCSSSCEYGTTHQWFTKSLGIYILLNLGSFLGSEEMKKKENLRNFLDRSGLKYTIREIDKDWRDEEKTRNENVRKLMKSLESKKKA